MSAIRYHVFRAGEFYGDYGAWAGACAFARTAARDQIGIEFQVKRIGDGPPVLEATYQVNARTGALKANLR